MPPQENFLATGAIKSNAVPLKDGDLCVVRADYDCNNLPADLPPEAGTVTNYVCGKNNKWYDVCNNKTFEEVRSIINEKTKFRNRTINATIQVVPANVQSQCCPAGSCWDGASCIGEFNMFNDDAESIYICMDGRWRNKTYFYKQNWEGEPGFAPDYDPLITKERTCFCGDGETSSDKSNACPGINDEDKGEREVSSGLFYFFVNSSKFTEDDVANNGDHYCLNGTWTSRQALVATQLLKLAQRYADRYAVECGDAGSGPGQDSGLMNMATPTEASGLDPDYSRICVMSWFDPAEHRFVGTFKQQGLGEDEKLVDAIVDQSVGLFKSTQHGNINPQIFDPETFTCNSLKGENKFIQCDSHDGRDDVILNGNTSSIIYNPEGISVASSTFVQRWFDTFLSLLFNPVKQITQSLTSTSLRVENAALDVQNFDKFYQSADGTSKIVGFVTKNTHGDQLLSISYYGVSENVCKRLIGLIKSVSPTEPGKTAFCVTQPDGASWKQTLLWKKPASMGGSDWGKTWHELTSKIRANINSTKPKLVYVKNNAVGIVNAGQTIIFTAMPLNGLDISSATIKWIFTPPRTTTMQLFTGNPKQYTFDVNKPGQYKIVLNVTTSSNTYIEIIPFNVSEAP
jgi:hypothetical protein